MRHLLLVAVVAVVSHAQTLTFPDINGNTVVGVITTNALGIPVTSTIETLPAGAVTTAQSPTLATTTSPTTTSTTTTAADQGQQGPVGQPTATTFSPGGPTPYTYTTVINGVTSLVADIFTPTNPATQQPTVGASGTIWDYSSWLSIYGPTTTAGAGVNGAVDAPLKSGLVSTLIFGFAVGMGLVLY
ncbi:hypothetical protein C0995_007964 [Termitomyces sp. Mi166|nr:hypothetical protein C0995_007964 [Termitomyces sp. Mi166\